MQTWIFRLASIAFFALQAGVLVHLLREGRGNAGPAPAERSVEIVWTLVPAALIAALVLMMSGATSADWSRLRDGGPGPLEPSRFVPVEVR